MTYALYVMLSIKKWVYIYLAYEINVYFYMLEIMDRVFLKCEILFKYTATGLQHFKVNTEVLKDFFRVTRVSRTGLYV